MNQPMHLEEQQRALTRQLEDVRAQNALLAQQGKVIEAEIASVRTNLETRRPPPIPIARPSEPERAMHPLVRAILVSSLFGAACALVAYAGMTIHAAATLKPVPAQIMVRTVTVPGPTVYRSVPTPTMPPGGAVLPRAPANMGWILVEGPPGSRVYERNRLLGATPFVALLPIGEHSLRVDGGWFKQHGDERTSTFIRVESDPTVVGVTYRGDRPMPVDSPWYSPGYSR